jgi:hypothetical protein
MKRFLSLVLLLFCLQVTAQRKSDKKAAVAPLSPIAQIEESIKDYALGVMNAEDMIDRFRADSLFTRGLVLALRQPNSFQYRFDSLTTISKLYAPDSTFRIFTWQVMKDFSSYRQHGAIQMRTLDGSLKLIPLFDHSDYSDNPFDSVRTPANWIGAVYYGIVQKSFNNKQFYTLLGYDESNARSTKKWMEVLHFDPAGKPLFGGKFFTYTQDSIKPAQPAFRFCLEYKKQAGAKFNYDPEIDKIVFAHLVSENGEVKERYSLIPYGTFEGFHWLNGKWIHEKNVDELDPKPVPINQ